MTTYKYLNISSLYFIKQNCVLYSYMPCMSTMLETANTKKSFQFSLKQLAKKTASEVDRKMDCYLCYFSGSPWAPRN